MKKIGILKKVHKSQALLGKDTHVMLNKFVKTNEQMIDRFHD